MMTNTSNQALEYRQTFKRLYYLALVGAILAEIVILRLNLVKLADQSQLIFIVKILVASSVPLSILVRLLFFVRPRLFARYWLKDECLVIEREKKKFELKFSDISRVFISKLSPRFLGGFAVEMQSGQKLRFPSALAGNHLILDRVAKIHPELFPEKTLSSYLLLSQQVDASWARMARKTRKIPLLVVKYVMLPALLSFVWYQIYPSPEGMIFLDRFMIVVSGHCLYVYTLAFVVNHLEERVFLRLFSYTHESGEREGVIPPWDRQLTIAAQVIFYTVCLSLYFLLSYVPGLENGSQ